MKKITQVVLHENAHLDEHLALFLVREYGKHRFDVSGATLGDFTTGVWPEGLSAENSPGVLFLGCAGGMFDEHGKDREICCARLVADYLAIGREKSLDNLLYQVEVEDREGAGDLKNHLALVVKGMAFFQGKKTEEVYKWLKPLFTSIIKSEQECWDKVCAEVDALNLSSSSLSWAEKNARFRKAECLWLPFTLENCAKLISKTIDAKFAAEWLTKGQKALAVKQELFEAAVAEIKASGRIVKFESFRGSVSMLVIQSDNPQVGPATRYQGYDIVVHQKRSGNTTIMTKKGRQIWLNNVTKLIRAEEAQLRGVDVSKQKLDCEGTLMAVPNWHLHEGICTQLYNGTLTASAVEPTAISLDRVVELVQEGLKPRKPRVKHAGARVIKNPTAHEDFGPAKEALEGACK